MPPTAESAVFLPKFSYHQQMFFFGKADSMTMALSGGGSLSTFLLLRLELDGRLTWHRAVLRSTSGHPKATVGVFGVSLGLGPAEQALGPGFWVKSTCDRLRV